jgi:hypothetical protein
VVDGTEAFGLDNALRTRDNYNITWIEPEEMESEK